VINGGFEDETGWFRGGVALPVYVSEPVHNGLRAMLLGRTGLPALAGDSAIWQEVPLPLDAQQITLSFWYYPLSPDAAGADRQEVWLYDAWRRPLAVLWRGRANDGTWRSNAFDLTTYRGQNLYLYFNVYNDGQGEPSAMYLDDISLLAYSWLTPTPAFTPTPGPTATFTATPFPTRAPSPTVLPCQERVIEGGFENPSPAWKTDIRHPARYSTTQSHSGSYSMLLSTEGANAQSSSVWQQVTIPVDAETAVLTFWYWPQAPEAPGYNRQELLLLDETGQLLEQLWQAQANDRAWRQLRFDLARYRGQAITLKFNAFSGSAVEPLAMYLDDVSLVVCGSILPSLVPGEPVQTQEQRLAAVLNAVHKHHGPYPEGLLLAMILADTGPNLLSIGYSNTLQGIEAAVQDAVTRLRSYGEGRDALVRAVWHYDGGPNPYLAYRRNQANPHYLADLADLLEPTCERPLAECPPYTVATLFGPQYADYDLAQRLRRAQKEVDARVLH